MTDLDEMKREFPLAAKLWFRQSTSEWVLEVSGEINDSFFISRHTQPASEAPEDAASLRALYADIDAQAATIEALRARLAKADELARAVDEWETAEPDSDAGNGFNLFCALAAYRATATDTGEE